MRGKFISFVVVKLVVVDLCVVGVAGNKKMWQQS